MNNQLYSLLILLLFLAIIVNDGAEAKRRNRKKSRRSSRPNIIFILMDDLDVQLGSLEVMKKTRKMFEREGAEFVNAFVTSPICCPSRSSILTGMYAHNHGCMTNTVNCASSSWRRGPEKKTFGVHLQESGYKTGYFGKYLNNYDGSWIPNGWDNWSALIRNSRFYNYKLNRNNFIEHHGSNYKKDYFTDVITNYSIEFFQESRTKQPDKPVMMVLSMAAPHGPEDPAPQHRDLYENVTAPRHPNFNIHSTDKHWLLQYTKPMDSQKIAFSDLLHRRRLLTLLSVDDAIDRLYRGLKGRGMLKNTYIFLSSDHGYHLGQFGLAKGKSLPYETDIRVPFYALGPKIPKAARIKDIVLNIDLAPTFLDLGNARIPGSMDGNSIVKLLESIREKKLALNWRETFLIEKSKSLYASKYKPRKSTDFTTKSKGEWIRQKCNQFSYNRPCNAGQEWTCVVYKRKLRLRKCRRTPVDTKRRKSRASRNSERKRCRCSKNDRGRSSYRRYAKRSSGSIRRGHYRHYHFLKRNRKEMKKLEHYERHLRKESSASYNKKVFKKTIQQELKKIKMRIQSLRILKKRMSNLLHRPISLEKNRCRCIKKLKRKKNKKRKKNTCAIRGLNCFQHTNHHWKTPPLWTNGSFCFCPTSSNNTYWCLRTINATHNFLYCEFVTSFCEFFDLNTDPYQLTNKINNISLRFHQHLHQQLQFLADCRQSRGCEMYPGRKIPWRSSYPLEKACTNRKYTS